MEVLCAIHGFPKALADSTRGQQQYLEISQAVENNVEVKNLIAQLETYYDRVLSGSQSEEKTSLSPNVESFLREMGERLDGALEGEDGD